MSIFNLFPVYDEIDDKEVRRISKIKTILFIGFFVISIILTAIFYSTTEVSQTQIANKPNYSRYLSLIDANDIVICDCQTVSINIREFTNVTIPADAFCHEAHQKYTVICNQTYGGIPGLPGSGCAGSSIFSFYKSLDLLCTLSLNTYNQQMSGFQSQILVTERLLDQVSLNERISSKAELSTIISESVLEASAKIIDGMHTIDRPLLHTFWEVLNMQFDDQDPDFEVVKLYG